MNVLNLHVLKKGDLLNCSITSYKGQGAGDVGKIETSADRDLLNLRVKRLKSAALERIAAFDKRTYKLLDWKQGKRSLPCEFKDGIYLFPRRLVAEMDAELEARCKARGGWVNGEFIRGHYLNPDSGERELTLVEQFLADYLAAIERMEHKLGEQFDRSKYPSINEVRHLFTADYEWLRIGIPEDATEFQAGFVDREKAKMAAKWGHIEGNALKLVRAEALWFIRNLTRMITERNKQGGKLPIQEATLVNMKEFFRTIEARADCAGADEDMILEMDKVRLLLDGVDAENLRSDEDMRDEIRKQFEDAARVLAADFRIGVAT